MPQVVQPDRRDLATTGDVADELAASVLRVAVLPLDVAEYQRVSRASCSAIVPRSFRCAFSTDTVAVSRSITRGLAPVTITSVTLDDPHGLTMLKPFATPWDGPQLGVRPYPPSGPYTGSWKLRRPAAGAVIAPHEAKALVFGVLVMTRAGGHAAGATLDYTAGGSSYAYQSRYALKVVVSPAHC